jgi:hypothetical protein
MFYCQAGAGDISVAIVTILQTVPRRGCRTAGACKRLLSVSKHPYQIRYPRTGYQGLFLWGSRDFSVGLLLTSLYHVVQNVWGYAFTPPYVFLNVSTRWHFLYSILFPANSSTCFGRNPLHILQEAWWAQEPVWKDTENLAVTGFRALLHSACSEFLYRLPYPVTSERFVGI